MWRGGVVGELGTATLHVSALGRKIKLSLDGPLEFARQAQWSINGEVRKPSLDELGKILDDVEVGPHHLGDFRPAHLQRDDPAIQHNGPVDLRDRRRCHRRLFDRRKHLGERPFVFLTQNRLDLGERERSDVVA